MQKNKALLTLLLFPLLLLGASALAEEELPDIGSDIPTAGEELPSADLPSDVTESPDSGLAGASEVPDESKKEEELASDPEPEGTQAPEPIVVDNSPPVPGSSQASVAETYDPRVPLYQQLHPSWAIDLSATMKPFKGQIPGASADATTFSRGFTVRGEFQPKALSRFGVVGLGTTLSLYPVFPKASQTSNVFSIWSLGGQVRYQARFIRNQILVPWAGFAFESFSYALKNGTSGRASLSGPFFGGALLLDAFDRGMASDFYADSGVLRTYAYVEMRALKGSGSGVTLSESSLYFGLRFEL